ncbi:MAG: hypothetical protein ACXWEW_06695, partial [Nitrososphaeraceae archaeon]
DLDTFVESLFGSQISEEITNKYSSNIINESKNNEKLPDIQSKSIFNNEPIHNIEELYQNTPSSSNLDPIISNNINNHDIAISKVELKEEEKKVDDLRNNNIINLENESQFGKSEKIAQNDDEKKKGFFSSLFGKRKSLVNSDKVSSTTADQKSKQNNQGKPNSDKHQYNTINKNELSEKNKNKDKNEVKYLSDDDLDELLKE